MKYDIYSNGKKINTIVADENFCKAYCLKNGYTYNPVEVQSLPDKIPAVTFEEQLRADIDYIAIMTGVKL